MRRTRREVLKTTAVGSLAALLGSSRTSMVWAQPASVARRMKLEDFVKDQVLVDALKRGVAKMKLRKPSDPSSWFFQGAIHGVQADAVKEALKADPDVAKVDQEKFWNRCPHFPRLNASSADFLVWHRAYLYHFERILRDAAKEDRLCLPYWNYLAPGQQTFPALYANPAGGNPLADTRRENAFTAGVLALNTDAVNADDALAHPNFFGAVAGDGFAGAAGDAEPGAQGLLERNPHNLVHFATGGFIGTDPQGPDGSGGLMSDVTTAAFDPIFWAHHSNIDRLWSVWECMPNRAWGYPPGPDWFSATPWWFYDVDGKPKNLTRAFYMQQKNLEIVFDTDVEGAPRLSDKLPAQKNLFAFDINAAMGAAAVVGEDRKRVEMMGATGNALKLTPKDPTSAKIRVDADQPFGLATLHTALIQPPAGGERRALLILQGVHYTGVPSVSYDIYANVTEGEKPTRKSTSFVGVLALFGTQHVGSGVGGHGGHAQVYDVGKAITAGMKKGAEFKITFVPVPLLVASQPNAIVKPARAPGDRPEEVTITAISLSGVEGLPQDR